MLLGSQVTAEISGKKEMELRVMGKGGGLLASIKSRRWEGGV